jgi:hypothetical protein
VFMLMSKLTRAVHVMGGMVDLCCVAMPRLSVFVVSFHCQPARRGRAASSATGSGCAAVAASPVGEYHAAWEAAAADRLAQAGPAHPCHVQVRTTPDGYFMKAGHQLSGFCFQGCARPQLMHASRAKIPDCSQERPPLSTPPRWAGHAVAVPRVPEEETITVPGDDA